VRSPDGWLRQGRRQRFKHRTGIETVIESAVNEVWQPLPHFSPYRLRLFAKV